MQKLLIMFSQRRKGAISFWILCGWETLQERIILMPMFRLTIFCFATVWIIGCSKDKAGDKLHGEWTLKSQEDIMGGVRGYILFDQTIPKKLRFSPEGKVYSTGIVTPT